MSCVMLGGKPYDTEEYYAHCVQQIRAFDPERLIAYKKWLAGTFLECLKTIINRELSQEQFFVLYVGIQNDIDKILTVQYFIDEKVINLNQAAKLLTVCINQTNGTDTSTPLY